MLLQTAKWENITEQTMAYQADQFGFYLALAVHGGTPVDLLDEDALLNTTVMATYQVLFITQPNLPKHAIAAAVAWAKAGGRLVLSGGAAAADEYNTPDSTIATATGCETSPFPRVVMHEVRQVPGPSPLRVAANGTVALKPGGASVPWTALGSANSFTTVGGASKVLSKFDKVGRTPDSSAAAATETPVGSGLIVQLAWQPGLSYLSNGECTHCHRLCPCARGPDLQSPPTHRLRPSFSENDHTSGTATQEYYIPNARTQVAADIGETIILLLGT